MEKVTEIPSSPWDLFFLPVWVHKKISIDIKGLVPALVFVGIFDMFFFDNIFKLSYFNGSIINSTLKLIVFFVCSLIIGAIDIVCTTIPLAEFAIMIGKRSEKYVCKRLPVILMKSYALSHLLFVIPTAFYVYSGIDWMNICPSSSNTVRIISAIVITLMMIVSYLQFGVFYRTLSVRTKLQRFGKFILVFAAYYWMNITGEVIVYLEGIFHSFIAKMG